MGMIDDHNKARVFFALFDKNIMQVDQSIR